MRFEEKAATQRSIASGTSFKAIEWARKYGTNSAVKKFKMDAEQIKK